MGAHGTLVVLIGATGVGKSEVAVRLAEALGCSIVNADSRQVYGELQIGAASPTAAQLARVPHYLVGHKRLSESYSCGAYERDALSVLTRLFAGERVAMLTGGSMLYIDAVCDGIDDFPAPDMALRERLNRELAEGGACALAARLREVDPASYEVIDRCNGARLVRALEVSLQTGRPYSEWRTGRRAERDFSIVKVGICRPWDELSARIGRRVDAMVAAGLEQEVRGLLAWRNCHGMRSVGYSEMLRYIDGEWTLAEAVEKIKVNTRRYAKRQMRWWQRDASIRWFEGDAYEEIFGYLCGRLGLGPEAVETKSEGDATSTGTGGGAAL